MEQREAIFENAEVRAVAGENGDVTIEGYGVVFNQVSRNLGGFQEIIQREAFENVDLGDVVATFNHNFDYVLGRTSQGTLQLELDDHGLKYRFKDTGTSYSQDLVKNLENGNVRGSSFMFTVDYDDIDWDFERKVPLAEIKRIDRLIELGPVTMPAYPQTDAGVAGRNMVEAMKQAKEQWERSQKPKERVSVEDLKLRRKRKPLF